MLAAALKCGDEALRFNLGERESKSWALASDIEVLQSNVGDPKHKVLASETGGRQSGL